MSKAGRSYTATVISTKDPEGLGRIKVALPGFSKEPGKDEEGEWVRISGAAAGSGMGLVWLPEDGQEVVVSQMSSGGEMVMSGSVYNGEEKPPYSNEDGDNNLKMLKTRSGHEVIFSDEDGNESISITTPDKKVEILFENSGPKITIKCEDKIEVTAQGDISIKGKNIAVEGDNVDIKAKKATVKASQTTTIEGSSKVTVKGSRIDLKN